VSLTKHTSTTKRTSRAKKAKEIDKTAWLTTWQDTPGVRHLALAKREDKDHYLVDVFTPCNGYICNALDNTGTEMAVTCVACLNSTFAGQCNAMNLEAIDHLDDSDLVDHFLDHDAMSILYDPW
jgi:hypothetical protein